MPTLREQYRPHQLKLLFIGESPPAGGTFFYEGNSSLFKYTRQAFSTVLDHQWNNEVDFLEYFKSSGCYLEDLCLAPVNNMDHAHRLEQREMGIIPLANRLSIWTQPNAIVIVGCSIINHVTASITIVGWNIAPFVVAFPAMSHQNRFITELTEILETALKQDWIDPLV